MLMSATMRLASPSDGPRNSAIPSSPFSSPVTVTKSSAAGDRHCVFIIIAISMSDATPDASSMAPL